MDAKNLLSQAQSVWSMLDDLANSDPSAYQKFISRNLDEGRKWMEKPKPVFCVKIKQMDSTDRVYLNFCSYARIPKPESLEAPIPVTTTSIESSKDKSGTYKVLALVFNPEVLENKDDDVEVRSSLISLAKNYLKNQHDLLLEEEFKILKQTRFKGDEKILSSLFTSRNKAELPTCQNFLDSPASLLKAVVTPIDSEDEQTSFQLPGNNDKVSGHRLIEEIETQPCNNSAKNVLDVDKGIETRSSLDQVLVVSPSSAVDGTELKTPEFRVQVSEASRSATVEIELPGIKAVSECELHVSHNLINLEVPDIFRLQLQSKCEVNEDTVSAKFIKPKQQLIINLQFLKK